MHNVALSGIFDKERELIEHIFSDYHGFLLVRAILAS